MARIRSVHPGLWTDESFMSLTMPARLLFIGIWNECDDQGAFEWKPLTLKVRLLPADNVDVPALLAELEHVDAVRSYQENGKKYGAVRNFARFQRPKKPNSVHPMPSEFRTYAGHEDESSEPDPDIGGPSSPPVPHHSSTNGRMSPQMEEGGWIKEEVKGRKEDRSLRSLPQRQAAEAGVEPFGSGASEVVAPTQPSREVSSHVVPSAPAAGSGRLTFDDFWVAYPRKVGKDDARRAFERVIKRGVPIADLLAALQRQRWRHDDPSKIPHPATWLNGGRWQDDPDAAAPNVPKQFNNGWAQLAHEWDSRQPALTIDHEEELADGRPH